MTQLLWDYKDKDLKLVPDFAPPGTVGGDLLATLERPGLLKLYHTGNSWGCILPRVWVHAQELGKNKLLRVKCYEYEHYLVISPDWGYNAELEKIAQTQTHS
jgi:hypothetical protein